MNTQSLTRPNEDAPLQTGPITVLRTQLEQRATEFRMVLPAHISPDKFQRTILTAVQNSPNNDLLMCDRRSLLTACMKAAQDGLLPDGREAAIVPFNTRMKVDGEWRWVKLAQYMPMVYGLRKKILQSDEVTDIYAAVVYRQELEAERFIHREGSEHKLFHAPIYDLDFKPKNEDIALVYSVATFANGYLSFEVMRRYEIDEVRQASQTGAEFDAKGEPRDAKGPWVEWFAEMCKKTVIRRHSKSLPQSSDVMADVEAEDMAFASRSALALLDRTKDEPPKVESRVNVDPDEQLQGGNNPEPEPEPEVKPEPKPEPKPKEKPKAAPKPEPEPEPEPDPAAPSHVDASDNDPPEAEPEPEMEETPPVSASEPPAEFDELGVTKTPDEIKADEYVTRAKACETIIDFRKLEREAEMDLAEMPVHLANIVDTVFEQTRKRLTPRKNS